MTPFSNWFFKYDVKYHLLHHRNTTFVLKLVKLVCYFLFDIVKISYFFICRIQLHIRSNFPYHRRLERFQKILCISKLFRSRCWGIKILTMIDVQTCRFLAKSENWTNVYACCSCKFIISDECLVYMNSLDFPLNTLITKIVQFHNS